MTAAGERLEARGETLKLARLLGVEAEDLAFLEDLPPGDVRRLRDSATRRLFDANAALVERIAAAGRILPSPLVAVIAENAFGALLSARVAGALDTGKAVDVACRLSIPFLTDVAVELDPRRAGDIIGELPGDLVVPIASELAARFEYVAMGRFLGYLSDACVGEALAVLDNDTLLRTAFVVEHKERLDRTIGLLGLERVGAILRHADTAGLWPEALDLLVHLSPVHLGPIADLVAGFESDAVDRVLGVVAAEELWESLAPLVAAMSVQSRERFLAALSEPSRQRALSALGPARRR